MDPLLYINDYSSESSEFKIGTKTEEEIKKLTLDENMSELKRSIFILSKGMPVQKTAIYMNLHKILLEPEAWQKIIPLVNEEILSQSEENQIEAAKSIVKLIKNNEIEINNLFTLLKICFSMLKIWNQPVLDSWVLVFGELIKAIIPFENIEKECYQLILNLSESTQHTLSKYIASRMMGFIAQNVSKVFSGLIFDRARVLCQDHDPEVRKIMSSEVIEKICINVGRDILESKMLEKILELIYDHDVKIKLHSIDLLINVLDLLSPECKKSRMVQTFIDLLSTVNEEIYKKMSFQIGQIVYKLESAIIKVPSQVSTILNFYKECGMHKLPEVRKNFAYNLPYLITVLEQKELFKNIYLKLFKDPVKEVRYQALLCFHEICKYIGFEESQRLFREAFESLFKEEEKLVLQKFLSMLSGLLIIFLETAKGNGNMEDIIKPCNSKEIQNLRTLYFDNSMNLVKRIKKLHYWRLELQFLEEFAKVLHLFNIRELNEKYYPYLLETIKKGVIELKPIAIKNMISFLRMNYISAKSKEIINALNEDFYSSENYHYRMIYLDFFNHMSKFYSTRYLKQNNLLQNCMNLSNDINGHVRKKFISILPSIKKVILFDDNENLKRFEDIITKLSCETDKEICESMNNFKKELKNIMAESPAQIDFEEKRRIEQEEELKNRELREIEEKKKNRTEENGMAKLDYMQNYSVDKLKNSKGIRKATKEPSLPKPIPAIKAPVVTGLNGPNLPISSKAKPTVSIPSMLQKSGPKIGIAEEISQTSSSSSYNLSKANGKISTTMFSGSTDNPNKKSTNGLPTTAENIHPRSQGSAEAEKNEKIDRDKIHDTKRFGIGIIKSVHPIDISKSSFVNSDNKAISSTNKLTILKDNPLIKDIKISYKKK